MRAQRLNAAIVFHFAAVLHIFFIFGLHDHGMTFVIRQFDGDLKDYDAAQISAPGTAGVCCGDALPGESDPEAGGVPGKTR